MLFATIKEKLVLSCGSELEAYVDMLSKEQTKEMVNEIINAGLEVSRLAELQANGHYIRYAPIPFIVLLFTAKPELFFDGSVWSESYREIQADDDVKKFMQDRTKALYQGCLDDLMYYMTYKNQSDFVLQKTKLAVQLLKQKVTE